MTGVRSIELAPALDAYNAIAIVQIAPVIAPIAGTDLFLISHPHTRAARC